MGKFLPALFVASACLAASPNGVAQQSPSPPQAPSTTVTVEGKPLTEAELHAEGEREVKQEEKQRILKVVPNFHTVLSGVGVGLAPAQKTQLAIHASLDPFNAVSSFLLAGASEAQGTFRGYGWGPAGYFKRTGASYADITDATMLSGALFPILLHQDPRYFRQGKGSIRSRIGHAFVSAYICRGDDGSTQPNYSNVLGNLSAGALSNLYYPAQNRGAGLTFRNGGLVIAEGSLGNIALEFSSDINAWWAAHHPPK